MAIKYTKLTKAGVKALASGAKLSEHGLFAKKKANGDVAWGIETMVDGERIHRVVGTEAAGVTREQAERELEGYRTRAREGRLNLPAGRKTHRSVAEAAAEYIGRLEREAGANIAIKRRQFRMYIIPLLGRSRLASINEDELKGFIVKRREDGAAAATINRELATISHLLRSAVRWRWIKQDDVPSIPMQKEEQRPFVTLTNDEAGALMRAAAEDQDNRLWLFVPFGLQTAMRHREILQVKYEDIDLNNRRIFVPHAKAGEREQPITTALANVLASERKSATDTEWVFPTMIPGQSTSGHRTNMARPFQRAVQRAGLSPSKVTPHTMRRTAITNLIEAGIDLPTVQRISGHRTLAMVLRYAHLRGAHINAAIDRIGFPDPS